MFPQDLIANSPNVDAQLFYANGTSKGFQTWHKPIGKCMAYMVAIGAGGGAGGADPSGTIGAGGGGAGAISTLLIPLWCLPDTLSIRVGLSGVGGTSGVSGLQPQSTVISINALTSAANIYLIAYPGGGGASTSSGGAGGGASAQSAYILSSCGIWVSLTGATGGTGGNNTNASAITALSTCITCAGAGGGGGSGNGGDITGAGLLPTSLGGLGSVVGNGNPGAGGIQLRGLINGLMGTGGAGGGATTVAADTGGNGGSTTSFGCGGGGGGSSTLSTGGTGGAGGPGFVGIWCF